jgi:hypothetical protein
MSVGDAVSDMYGFGVDEEQGIEPQAQTPQAPKWFRERMDEVSETLKGLKAENERLKESQRQTQVAEALTAKGYASTAAGLYQGDPAKLDDWLGTYGAGLAKTDGAAAGEAGQGVQGTPQTVVSPESQAAMQQMAAAGQGATAAMAGDDQLAARLAATREQGNKFV